MVGNLWPRIMALAGVEPFGGGDLADLGGPDFDGGVVPFAGRGTPAQDEPHDGEGLGFGHNWTPRRAATRRRAANPAGSRLVTGGGSL